jgi:hypothetical protein
MRLTCSRGTKRSRPERALTRGGVIRAVSAQDVMQRFGVGRTVGYGRLRALVDHGLLTRAPRLRAAGRYVATRGG